MQLIDFLHDTHGFFTREQARESGYSDTQIAAAVRSGHWVRFRRGYYAYGDVWRTLDEVGRHRVRSRAVLHSLGQSVVLSHVSAAIEHGMVTWGHRLDRVHVTRLDGGAGRVEGDVVHHEGLCLADDVRDVQGLRVLSPARSAIEAASTVRSEAALCTLDSVLHLGLTDHDQLMTTFVHMRHWPRTRHLHIPVRLADAGSDGPGESRGKWLFWSHGIPAPRIQFEVYDASGVLRGTCDWGWPDHGVLGEFDGRVKYGRHLQASQEPGDVVFAEKQREDLLRELTGFSMVRLVWTDFQRPNLVADRVRRALRRVS